MAEVNVDGAVIALTATLAVLTAGILAAASMAGTRGPGPVDSPTGQLNAVNWSPKNQLGRQLLVAGQVALTLILLIGSSLMIRSYQRLVWVDLGFQPDDAITFFLPLPANPYADRPMSAGLHHDVRQRLRALPGVEAVESATTAAFPLTPVPDHYNDRVTIAGIPRHDSTSAPRTLFSFATPGYFQTMGIPFFRGRAFEDVSNSDSREVILSTTLARDLFGTDDPIGQRVRSLNTGGGDHIVVGVVGDAPGRSVREGPTSVIYFANLYPTVESRDGDGALSVVLRDEQYVVRSSLPPTVVFPAIRRIVNDVDPKLVISGMSTLDDLVANSLVRPRMTMLLLLAAATAALVLGLTGIYGVLSYAVRQRTRELGIRVALRASPTNVTRMVVWHGAFLSLVGITAGLIAAVNLAQYLESLLYGVTPSDPTTYVVTAMSLLGVSLAASYIPARRAGRIDPVRALKI